MSREFIKTENLCKSFAGVDALQDVSISIRRGEIRCLAGENGSGKSTFIKIIAGVYPADAGEISIDGTRIRRLRPIDAIHAGIQVIYQDFSLFPNLTVAENLALNTFLGQNRFFMNWGESKRIASRALEQIGTAIDLDQLVADLQVAEKQLIAIAKCLLQDARLIIMDEPTTALTGKEIERLFTIIKQLQDREISVLFVTHKLNEILEISDSITILRDGRKAAEGKTSDFDYEKLVFHMTGRKFETSRFGSKHEDRETQKRLRVDGLSKQNAFSNISLECGAGEILGITGLLGSGRTELALSLFGIQPADSGEMFLDGNPVRIDSPQVAIDNGIAYVPEDRLTEGLFPDQPVAPNISVANLDAWCNRWGFLRFGAMYNVIRQWVKTLNIKVSSVQLPVRILSGGNQQKVVLARWLATSIKVLILNGPTVGIDIGAKEEIHRKLKELALQGLAIVLMSDDLSELIHTCNRILIMHRGEIVERIDPAEWDENRLAATLSELR